MQTRPCSSKRSEFAQTAVQIAAECGSRFLRVNRAVNPALHKNRRNAVADLKFRYLFADLDDFARAVGKRHKRRFKRGLYLPVTIIKSR